MIYIASLTVIARGSWVGQIKWAFRLYVGCTSKDLFNPSLLPKPIPKLFHMNGLTVWYLMLWIKPHSMLFQGTKIFWVFHFLKGLQEQTFCLPPHICCFLTPSPLPLSLYFWVQASYSIKMTKWTSKKSCWIYFTSKQPNATSGNLQIYCPPLIKPFWAHMPKVQAARAENQGRVQKHSSPIIYS